MNTMDALKTRRSIRRFSCAPVEKEKLEAIMEAARFYPSAANLQPLKFAFLADEKRRNQAILHTRWAGYLPEYSMQEADYPPVLLLVLGDKSISREFEFSAGAAANQIMLAATELGLASCCLGLGKAAKEGLLNIARLDAQRFEMLYVIALGYSDQTSRGVDMEDSCKYSLDDKGNFLVPKRKAEEIFLDI